MLKFMKADRNVLIEQNKEKNNLLSSDELVNIQLPTTTAVEWKNRHGKVYFHVSFIIKAAASSTRFRAELGVKDKVT